MSEAVWQRALSVNRHYNCNIWLEPSIKSLRRFQSSQAVNCVLKISLNFNQMKSVTGAHHPCFTSWWDTQSHTFTHTRRRQEVDGKIKTERKDSVASSSPLPHWLLSHLVMCLPALCPHAVTLLSLFILFFYPVAKTSIFLHLPHFLNLPGTLHQLSLPFSR